MLRNPTPEEARTFRAGLSDADFTLPALLERFGPLESPARHLRNRPRLLHATREPSAFNVLARWFVFGLEVSAAMAKAAIPARMLDLANALGVVEPRGSLLESRITLVPIDGLLVAADPFQDLGREERFDHVFGVNMAAQFLRDFMIRPPLNRALDLCCGNGLHALEAAAQGQRIVASDLNPRAAVFVAFNAALNGIENIECRTGDLFEPMAGESFNAVFCNPPFAVAPATRFLAHSNDMPLDGFVETIVRQVPRYLAEGGILQLVGEWVELIGEPWQDRLQRWFTDSHCDCWVLRSYTHSPEHYAQKRLLDHPFVSDQQDQRIYEQWLSTYRHKAVAAVHGGLIQLRRTRGAPWQRFETIPASIPGSKSQWVLDGFARGDVCAAAEADPSTLATCRLMPAPGTILTQQARPGGGSWQSDTPRLRLGSAADREIGLGPDVARFVGRFDGKRPVAELIRELFKDAPGDTAAQEADCLATVKVLVERGFLVPAYEGSRTG